MAINKNDMRVLACIDRSPYANAVVDCAAWAANKISAPLEIMHTIDRHLEQGSGEDHSGAIGVNAHEALLNKLTESDREKAIAAKAAGREFIQGQKERIASSFVGQLDTRLRHGSLLDALPDYVNNVRAVVLGLQGEAAKEGPEHVGKTFEAVVRSVNRPILAVHREFLPPSHFVFAFDGSAVSRRGIRTVVESQLFTNMTGSLVMFGQPKAANLGILEAAAQELSQAGVATKAIHVDGDIALQLPNIIKQQQAGLLVMGAYTHHPVLSLLRGSKTTELLEKVNVPALLLR